MCLCFRQRPHLRSSSADQESKESNGRERQIAHTQIPHAITHTHTRSQRNVCTQPQHKQKKKGKTNKAWDDQRTHSLIAPVKQNTHTEGEREVAHSMQ
ncbi:hypothetical protein TCDM_13261 [Trypanosoma cruzi Dm28c]|uniref:Uncharacterized protein n=1 Tax=Trypanosoma cruzi Dm28c TaxID=1416333 RepID=V5AT59_TRYCR|nr:hypothetical protein TCDM_13261 [Trypanosoma cruzi Dm28c]